MRHPIIGLLSFVLVAGVSGCMQKNDSNDDGEGGAGSEGSAQGSGGEGGSSASNGGSGGSEPGVPGWTAVPLIDDATKPDDIVYRAGNDLVTGIHFASVDDGWIVTAGSDGTFGDGGAVFKATQKQVTDVLFSGNRDGLCLLGSIEFTGFEKTSDGFIATSYACDVIASHDGGKTFEIAPATAGDKFGIEPILALRSHAAGTTFVSDSGYVATTSGAPGPTATWTDLWAPDAIPTIPDPVPADQCQTGPSSPTPTQRTTAFIGPDAKLIAYTANADNGPEICISTDGGKSFFPKLLEGVGEGAMAFEPTGVVFANATNGIAFWASSIYPGEAFIFHTADAGQTWKSVPLPAEVAGKAMELASAFFAPDGTNGWIVGYDYDSSAALLLKTSDGGATWKKSGGDLAQKVSEAGGDKLFTGFALDANRIWVGGKRGILMANEAGGD